MLWDSLRLDDRLPVARGHLACTEFRASRFVLALGNSTADAAAVHIAKRSIEAFHGVKLQLVVVIPMALSAMLSVAMPFTMWKLGIANQQHRNAIGSHEMCKKSLDIEWCDRLGRPATVRDRVEDDGLRSSCGATLIVT
ncbi:hypothetical protein FI667_g4300, partial [Globisporangium splendens]